MTASHSDLLVMLAGVAVFMYGLNISSENLQKLAANRIRDLLVRFSNKPIWGVMAGTVLTVIFQSSGAVTSMLVGLATAGVMNLPQVMSLIIGVTIGTTFTVQILFWYHGSTPHLDFLVFLTESNLKSIDS